MVPYTFIQFVGMWLSLVERSVRDGEVGGSNPLTPIFTSICISQVPNRKHFQYAETLRR